MEKKDRSISIIVPLYRGEKYIAHIVDQVRKNAELLPECDIELILYNDYPDGKIKQEFAESQPNLTIKVINSEINLGIHGARVEGLKESKNDIVMFLDQDDYIYPNYLKSQLDAMEEGDIVICKCFHNNKLHYSDSYRFEDVVSAEFMFSKWNPIVSPGQVILKKNIIPQVWTERILKINGSDDYYLWLLLAGSGIYFKLNNEVLFEHVMNDDNTSLDTNRMMDSEDEMISNLLDCDIFNSEQKKLLINLRTSLRRIHIKELEDFREAYYCYKMLNDSIPCEILAKRIGIYGAGVVGQTIGNILSQKYGIEIFYIDRNAGNISVNKTVYSPENVQGDVGAIIVSPLPGRMELVNKIQSQFQCDVYPLREFIRICNSQKMS